MRESGLFILPAQKGGGWECFACCTVCRPSNSAHIAAGSAVLAAEAFLPSLRFLHRTRFVSFLCPPFTTLLATARCVLTQQAAAHALCSATCVSAARRILALSLTCECFPYPSLRSNNPTFTAFCSTLPAALLSSSLHAYLACSGRAALAVRRWGKVQDTRRRGWGCMRVAAGPRAACACVSSAWSLRVQREARAQRVADAQALDRVRTQVELVRVRAPVSQPHMKSALSR